MGLKEISSLKRQIGALEAKESAKSQPLAQVVGTEHQASASNQDINLLNPDGEAAISAAGVAERVTQLEEAVNKVTRQLTLQAQYLATSVDLLENLIFYFAAEPAERKQLEDELNQAISKRNDSKESFEASQDQSE